MIYTNTDHCDLFYPFGDSCFFLHEDSDFNIGNLGTRLHYKFIFRFNLRIHFHMATGNHRYWYGNNVMNQYLVLRSYETHHQGQRDGESETETCLEREQREREREREIKALFQACLCRFASPATLPSLWLTVDFSSSTSLWKDREMMPKHSVCSNWKLTGWTRSFLPRSSLACSMCGLTNSAQQQQMSPSQFSRTCQLTSTTLKCWGIWVVGRCWVWLWVWAWLISVSWLVLFAM